MRLQLLTLDHLVQLLDPKLYLHLQKVDSTNFFFFFRMLLVWYKREFEWLDVLRLWEGLWTDYLSSNFHLFIAVAILEKHRNVIMEHLKGFDEVLKYGMPTLSPDLRATSLLTSVKSTSCLAPSTSTLPSSAPRPCSAGSNAQSRQWIGRTTFLSRVTSGNASLSCQHPRLPHRERRRAMILGLKDPLLPNLPPKRARRSLAPNCGNCSVGKSKSLIRLLSRSMVVALGVEGCVLTGWAFWGGFMIVTNETNIQGTFSFYYET